MSTCSKVANEVADEAIGHVATGKTIIVVVADGENGYSYATRGNDGVARLAVEAVLRDWDTATSLPMNLGIA